MKTCFLFMILSILTSCTIGKNCNRGERNDHGQLRSGTAGRFLPNGRHLWEHSEQLADGEFYRDSEIK